MKRLFPVSLLLLLLGLSAAARFARPQFVPVERLLKNLAPHVEKSPDDAQLNYTKARIHYLAFIHQSDLAGAFNAGGATRPPRLAPDWMLGGSSDYHRLQQHAREQVLKKMGLARAEDVKPDQRGDFYRQVNEQQQALKKAGWKPEPPDAAFLKEHAAAAYAGFNKTIKLDPKNGLAHLGLASFMEQYRSIVAGRPELKVPELETISRNRMVDRYYQAYAVSINDHLKLKSKPVSGMRSLAGYEAGHAFIRLVESEPPDLKNIADYREKLAPVKAGLGKLDQLPRGPITPLIFSLAPHASIEELVDEKAKVRFDLSGFGHGTRWPWVRPGTGILVWDPSGSGDIRSGRSLFGNYTWQVFWDDGFAALRALDDDGDGWLTGAELRGIRAWFDDNGNGVSEAGEMKELKALGIEALAVRPEKTAGSHLVHSRGLRRSGGEPLPLWDWVAAPRF